MPFDFYLDKPEFITDVWNDPAHPRALAAFAKFNTWLEVLSIEPADAWLYFAQDYNHGRTIYTASALEDRCEQVATTNAGKYDKLIAAYTAQYDPIENYRRVEESTHTRTPDLTRQRTPDLTTETTTDSTETTDRKQTKTTTETPPTNTETEFQVSPFDTSTYKAERKSITTQSGNITTEEAFEGDPDETTIDRTDTTTVTGTDTETETGTDETVISSTIYGNIGTLTTQKMLLEQMQVADKMNIFRIIEQDIAAAVLIGVW